jgi:hypothetical protein
MPIPITADRNGSDGEGDRPLARGYCEIGVIVNGLRLVSLVACPLLNEDQTAERGARLARRDD